ncbi:MAG: DUF1552 domain-containing protein [Myxococcota bacterium]
MKPISRRAVLRGALGGVLALPLLEAMMPRRASAAEAAIPRRFLVWSQPNGTVLDNWRPISGVSERDFSLSRILAPFERHKADMLVVQNLEQKSSYGHHYISGLTGRPANDYVYPNLKAQGISLDQYMANAWRDQTPIPSLELGVTIDGGRDTTACVSWAGVERPMPPESNPFAVYARLFGNGVPAQDDPLAARRIARRASVIDSVKDQVARLNAKLGTDDRAVLDNYLESVRAIERELGELRERQNACAAPDIGADPSTPGQEPWWMKNDNAPAVMRLQSRLAAAAFACDLTRIVTLTIWPSGGGFRFYGFLDGVSGSTDLHGHSHNVEVGNREPLTRIDIWHAQQLALLLDDFKSYLMPDGKTLLHHALVMSNNEYGPNGSVDYLPIHPVLGERAALSHYTRMMPYVFFGQAGGELDTGRNLECALPSDDVFSLADGLGQHHNRLLVSILNVFGFPDTTFGDPSFDQGALDGFYI